MQTTETLSDYERERGKPMPSLNHGTIQTSLIISFAPYRSTYSIVSELSLELSGFRGTPDICLYPRLSIDYAQDEIRMTEPPLVAVEIVSPTQPTQDVVDKIRQMLAAGVRSCWLVQPATQTITVYHDAARPTTFSEGVVTDAAVEDVEVAVKDVFTEA